MYQLLALLSALALLVCDTTAGLASRLAGSLALTAAALLCAFAEVTGLDGLDSLHSDVFLSLEIILFFDIILSYF